MSAGHTPSLPGHPTSIHFGVGVAEGVGAALPHGARILAVASARTRRRAPDLVDRVARHCDAVWVDGVPPQTTLRQVTALVDRYRGTACEALLAVGGGTTMDTAKALAIGIRTDAGFPAVLDHPDAFAESVLPLFCVPTTFGSGSDVTPWATLWDRDALQKRSLAHPALYPAATWIDPALATSLPPFVTATSGLDALAHAMEAVWNRRHSPETDALARRAMAWIFDGLPAAARNPSDMAARTGMAAAALAAGLAMSKTQTAAAHALSYPLTLRYGIPHGHACALSLPWLLRRFGRTDPERMGALTPDAERTARQVEALMARLGLPCRLRDLGVARHHLPHVSQEAMAADRMRNTVGALTAHDLDAMLRPMWGGIQ